MSAVQIHKTKTELLSFMFKIILHLSYNKNGMSGSHIFHKAILHIIYLNLLPISYNPMHSPHSSVSPLKTMYLLHASHNNLLISTQHGRGMRSTE